MVTVCRAAFPGWFWPLDLHTIDVSSLRLFEGIHHTQ